MRAVTLFFFLMLGSTSAFAAPQRPGIVARAKGAWQRYQERRVNRRAAAKSFRQFLRANPEHEREFRRNLNYRRVVNAIGTVLGIGTAAAIVPGVARVDFLVGYFASSFVLDVFLKRQEKDATEWMIDRLARDPTVDDTLLRQWHTQLK